jgi:predicted metal-dependent hydrolase
MQTITGQQRSTPFSLEVRKATRFDFTGVPAIHSEDNLYISHFFNALSLVAPVTEGMLIRAIRDAQPLLEGTLFAADAAAFIGQEAIHTREHRELNRHLESLGFSLDVIAQKMDARARRLESTLSLKQRLAAVVTGEHAIYALSRAFLATDPAGTQQHPEVRRLFTWHALEEMEHQSVCDDIYRHLYGGGLANRLIHGRAFLGVNVALYRMAVAFMSVLLAQDRAPRKGEMRAFWLWMLRNPAIGVVGARELLGYFSPLFSHWRRADGDRQLIRDGLTRVYEVKREELAMAGVLS